MTTVVVVVVTAYFVRALQLNREALSDVRLSVDLLMGLSLAAFALAVVVSGLLWGRMTSELGSVRIGAVEGIRVHCLSWLLKYVPGQVGSAVNKIAWAQQRGVSKSLALITFVYENVFLLVAAIVPSFLVLALLGTVDFSADNLTLTTILAVIPLVLVTSPPIMRRVMSLLGRRVLRRGVPSDFFLSWAGALKYQLAYLVPRLLNGAGLVAIATSMLEVSPRIYLPLACAYMFAGAAGLLALFVPGGIGVREAVFVALATPYLPVEQAIVVSLAARLVATLGDGVVAMIYGGLRLVEARGRT